MGQNELLAVYGTLKQGHSNHLLLSSSAYLGECAIPSGYGLFVDGLPFLVEDSNGPGCYGEMYEISKETLRRLDHLEGHPSVYKRTQLNVVDLETGHQRKCWVYIYQGKTGRDYVRRF